MTKSKKKDTTSRLMKTASQADASQKTVEVLYQKMGDRWFAFSVIDDEVFVGSIPQADLMSGAGGKAGNT